jgi:hypothetical protein
MHEFVHFWSVFLPIRQINSFIYSDLVDINLNVSGNEETTVNQRVC